MSIWLQSINQSINQSHYLAYSLEPFWALGGEPLEKITIMQNYSSFQATDKDGFYAVDFGFQELDSGFFSGHF